LEKHNREKRSQIVKEEAVATGMISTQEEQKKGLREREG